MTHHRKSITPNEGRRTILWKRDTSSDDDANLKVLRRRVTEQTFKNIFTKNMSANEAERHAIAGETGVDLDEVDAAHRLQEDDDTAAPTSTGTRRVSSLADLLVEASGNKVTREQALQFLLHSRSGRALAQTHKQQKETPPVTKLEDLPVVEIAKCIVGKQDAYALSEHELTALIQKHADRNRLPGESSAAAFARVVSAGNDEGLALRKALDVTKTAGWLGSVSLTPTFVGGDAATAVNDPKSALSQLQAMAERLRAGNPHLKLTEAQAFAQVFGDPANRALAARERQENRPSA